MKMQETWTTHAIKKPLIFLAFLLAANSCFAQQKKITVADDSTVSVASKISVTGKPRKDSSIAKSHSPRTAAIRSAIFPGLGQIYNKKYWKLPIVYGGMGVSAGVFLYNLKSYRDARFAYTVKYNMRVNHTDSAKFDQIRDILKPLSEESLRFYRNQYRRDIDYSALVFILLWGLNVVDATVDAHLKSFDVGPNLGLQLKPGHSDMAGTNGVSLVLNWR